MEKVDSDRSRHADAEMKQTQTVTMRNLNRADREFEGANLRRVVRAGTD